MSCDMANQIQENMKSRRSWSEKEDEAFTKLTSESQPKNWSVISKRLAYEFGFKRRSGKQCRQRWYNHLVPGISKKVWTKAQEEKLLSLHKTYGNKWTVIAEQMPGRTDNSIKNYFYSTVRRSLRRMGKLIGSKNSTSLMRAIKPSTLTHIFCVLSDEKLDQFHEDLKEQFESLQNLRQSCQNVRNQIIQFSSYKPKRTDQIDQSQRSRYERVFQIILKLNEVYQKFRGFQKSKKSQEQIFRQNFKQMMKEDSEDDSLVQGEQISNQESNSLQIIPTITVRKTRTRNIKIPEKLISFQDIESNVKEQLIQRQQENDLSSMKQPNFEDQLKLAENAPDFQNFIEEIESSPHFQIQLKQESNFNFNLQGTQSPNYFYGTPNNPVNFFKSPHAVQAYPPIKYSYFDSNPTQVVRNSCEIEDIDNQNDEL